MVASRRFTPVFQCAVLAILAAIVATSAYRLPPDLQQELDRQQNNIGSSIEEYIRSIPEEDRCAEGLKWCESYTGCLGINEVCAVYDENGCRTELNQTYCDSKKSCINPGEECPVMDAFGCRLDQGLSYCPLYDQCHGSCPASPTPSCVDLTDDGRDVKLCVELATQNCDLAFAAFPQGTAAMGPSRCFLGARNVCYEALRTCSDGTCSEERCARLAMQSCAAPGVASGLVQADPTHAFPVRACQAAAYNTCRTTNAPGARCIPTRV